MTSQPTQPSPVQPARRGIPPHKIILAVVLLGAIFFFFLILAAGSIAILHEGASQPGGGSLAGFVRHAARAVHAIAHHVAHHH